MPPRRLTLAIVLFWAATTLWLVYREGWEKSAQPPPFTIDRTDEIGVQAAVWGIYLDGDRIGEAQTRLSRPKGELLYDVSCDWQQLSDFTYRGWPLAAVGLSNHYRVTARGEMRSLSSSVRLRPYLALQVEGDFQVECVVEGTVQAELFRPLVKWQIPLQGPAGDGVIGLGQRAPGEVDVYSRGGVLNLLHPLHKVTGLWEGRRWRVPLFDPLAVALGTEPEGRRFPHRYFEAEVTAAVLQRRRPDDCWRIDLKEPGGVSACVWVRKRDDIVVQQEVDYGDMKIVLKLNQRS